jgi:cytochrome c1
MKDNQKTIESLTAAAFATEAPLFTDIFPVGYISLERAKRGEKLFNNACLKCHGEYQKAWNQEGSDGLSRVDVLKTTKVIYHEKTPVKDVGTDPQRYEGMKYFADSLNNLSISKWMQTKVEPQIGYVPPPLVGIWSRYPYLHNNSIPNLCALLSKEAERPKTFIQGPAIDKVFDYDQECAGYPVGANIPKAWLKDTEAKIDTTRPGLRNTGHVKMLLDVDGNEKFSAEDKKDLIHFLKTL